MEESSPQSQPFFLSEENGEVHARFDPGGVMSALDIEAVKQAVLDGGWRDLYLDTKALADFITRCGSSP